MATTYAELKAEIADYIDRSDFTAANSLIDTFIDQAEADFNRELRVLDMEAITTVSVVAATATYDKPTDYLSTINLEHQSEPKAFEKLTLSQITDRQLNEVDGRPFVYADYPNDKILLAPTPANAYTLNWYYYAKIPALSDVNTTNWLLTAEPELYLQRCLSKAWARFKDKEEEAKYLALSQAKLDDISKADRGNRQTRFNQRILPDVRIV